MKLDRFRQIAADLTAEIENGKYDIGDVFPIREKLAERFSVTKATLNKAMELLIEKGMLRARRGSGTVVVSTSRRIDIAYIASEWLMPYIPSAPNCNVKYIDYEDVFASRSSMRILSEYEGYIWSHPHMKYIPQIVKFNRTRPGIIINRTVPESNFVATDFTETFKTEIIERFRKYPAITPYLLSTASRQSSVHTQRIDGFISACRESKRFYEQIEMPEKFLDKMQTLEAKIDTSAPRPIMLFADDWNHTGAVMRWAAKHEMQWRKDLLYIDFENTEHEHVFGVITTSVLQDFKALSHIGLKSLIDIIKTPAMTVQKHLTPYCRRGDT